MIFSPLEQFNIISLLPISFVFKESGSTATVGHNYFLDFTCSSVAFGLTVVIFLGVCHLVYGVEDSKIVGGSAQAIVEMIYEFVCSLFSEQVNNSLKHFVYFPLVFSVFVFLLVTNLIGMVPYSFTATSHFVVTFGLSLSLFIGITLIGFCRHGVHFLSFFLPGGTPLGLIPLLVTLEIISYSFRAVSLGVRLAINLMSGHCLLKIIAGFALSMFSAGGILCLASCVPFGLMFALTGLELGVACLQAYVFTILLCIYLNDAVNLH